MIAPVPVMILDRHPDGIEPSSRAIGYWRSLIRKHLPDPHDYVDPSWDPAEREAVARYLDAGRHVIEWRGISMCRFCGKMNGSACLGDGSFVWPRGLSHYVRKHDVRLSQEFVAHVMRRSSTRSGAQARSGRSPSGSGGPPRSST